MFFALWPDPEWSQKLLSAAGTAIAQAGGRAVAGADLHVTLCFLGSVAEPVLAGLCERAAALRAADFALDFDALEYWPRSRVLAATSSGSPAATNALAGALRASAQALGLRPGEQPLRPHLTLVRGAASQQQPPASVLSLRPPLRLAARRFYLAQSHELEPATATAAHTPRYSRLESWPLE